MSPFQRLKRLIKEQIPDVKLSRPPFVECLGHSRPLPVVVSLDLPPARILPQTLAGKSANIFFRSASDTQQ